MIVLKCFFFLKMFQAETIFYAGYVYYENTDFTMTQYRDNIKDRYYKVIECSQINYIEIENDV